MTISLIDAAKRHGVTYRQAHHWATNGLIEVRNFGSPERGEYWLTSHEHRVFASMADLVNLGVAPRWAAVMARGDEGRLTRMENAVRAIRATHQSLSSGSVSGGR